MPVRKPKKGESFGDLFPEIDDDQVDKKKGVTPKDVIIMFFTGIIILFGILFFLLQLAGDIPMF